MCFCAVYSVFLSCAHMCRGLMLILVYWLSSSIISHLKLINFARQVGYPSLWILPSVFHSARVMNMHCNTQLFMLVLENSNFHASIPNTLLIELFPSPGVIIIERYVLIILFGYFFLLLRVFLFFICLTNAILWL